MSTEKKITHDSLQEHLERALNILKQRGTGCFTWHIALNEALSELSATLCPLFRKQEYEIPASARLAEMKVTAFSIINGKMLARYQNQHASNLDEEIFKLFETAKKVKFAQTEMDFQNAIADL